MSAAGSSMREERVSRRRSWSGAAVLSVVVCVMCGLAGCSDPTYDQSTPDAAINAAMTMVEDGRPDLLPTLLYLPAREITYDDGVTEASAIDDVRAKLRDLLAQMHRISEKVRERYPDDIRQELGAVAIDISGSNFEQFFAEFMADPFRFMKVQRSRVTTIDLGDGTAAILVDGQPPFGGIGLQMREVDGEWMIEVPIDHPAIGQYRPNTRHEWAVIASMMLGFENSLHDFEAALDDGEFRDLRAASLHVGRLMAESAAIQAIIYASMKDSAAGEAAVGSGRQGQ